MDNLVAELTTLNSQSDDRFDDREATPTRIVPIEYHRIVPIEQQQQQQRSNSNEPQQRIVPIEQQQQRIVPIEQQQRIVPIEQQQRIVPIEQLQRIAPTIEQQPRMVPIEQQHQRIVPIEQQQQRIVPIEQHRIVPIEMISNSNSYMGDGSEHDAAEAEVAAIAIKEKNDRAIGDKIAEINAMKDQLQRLKHMMDTVKLIEMKTGGDEDDELENDEEHEREQQRNEAQGSEINQPEHDQNYIPKSSNNRINNIPTLPSLPTQNEREDPHLLNEKVVQLQSITHDLRQQALSLVAQRDRIRTARDELILKQQNEQGEKNINQNRGVSPDMTPELDSKKKEYSNLLKTIEKEVDQYASNAEASKRLESEYLYYPDNWTTSQGPASGSSVHMDRPTSTKVKVSPFANGPGKDSADSGAADMYAVNIEAGSVQSGSIQSVSTRSLSMPPPMPNLPERSSSKLNFFKV